MSGYAVRLDGAGWRSVDGPVADPDNPSHIFPDGDIEYYSSTLPEPPVPLAEQWRSMADERRDSLLAIASLRIAPLQDAVDLGSATDAESSSLKSWKQYRVAVNRVSSQPGWPEVIDWPELPLEAT